MSEYYREQLLKENSDSRKASVKPSTDVNEIKRNDKSQNDDDKSFQLSLICKKDAEYAVTVAKVSSLPGLDKEIDQFDPNVQIHCKGMKESSNDSPTSAEIQSELDLKEYKSTIGVDFVLEDNAFPKDDSKGIG